MDKLRTEIAGLTFRNPVLTAAGPTSRDGMTLLNAAAGGAGGLVAKTVSSRPAVVPKPNMATSKRGRVGARHGILNAELWSELPAERWLEKEYAIALSSALPVVASLGYTPEEVSELGPKIEAAGVHALEFSTHYVGGHIEIAKALKEVVNIPVFAKLSPKIDLAKVAKETEPYVDGFVAINTYGPCLRIDIETGRPMLGSESGEGWLSGAAIRPIAVRSVAEIAQAVNKPVIGVGGVTSGEDVVEFMMAGASAVEVCTAAILEGQTVYRKITSELESWLDDHGHDSPEDIKGITLKHLEKKVSLSPPPRLDVDKCTLCGACVKSCVYHAIELDRENEALNIDSEKCEACGMCISVCPYLALSVE